MENRKIVLKSDLIKGFKDLGIELGDNLIVHTSLKNLGFVCGGAQIVIEALLESVGCDGTVIMPTQTWKNLDPSEGVHWEEPKQWWDLIRQNWPAYDKDITPTNTMGSVAEMFRKWPKAVRSDHPARSFAAVGKNSEYFMKNHDLEDIFGETSPLAKLYQYDGKVVLIGVDFDKNTSLHLADVRANYTSKHNVIQSSAMMVNGKRQWVSYETLYVDGEDFNDIGKAFENTGYVKSVEIGNTSAKIMNQKQLVDFAVKWIEQNRN